MAQGEILLPATLIAMSFAMLMAAMKAISTLLG
jgi:hypothetical protein